MTAPSLILLGHGSNDPQVPQVSHQIREGLLAIRPELDIHVAFLDHCTPSGIQVVNKLVSRGVEEIVFVPLLLSDAFHVQADVPALLAQVQASFPELRVIASRPIGPEAQLLSIIDRRLRDALRARHVAELDGLVFAAAGSCDIRSNALVARRARQWSTHHRLPCVTAFATGSGPSHCRGDSHPPRPGSATHRRRQLVPRARPALHGIRPTSHSRPARSRSRLRWVASPRSPRWP